MESKQGTDSASISTHEGQEPKVGFWRRASTILVGTIILAALLVEGLGYLVTSLTHETTDDAFLDGHILAVSPRVSGRVVSVRVSDNQRVTAGDLLLEIDPRDFSVALEQKRAAFKAAEANVELLRASLELSRTQVTSAQATAKQTAAEALAAEANAEKARSDLRRAKDLVEKKTISPQEYDTAEAAARALEANLKAAREKAASDESKVAEAAAQVEASQKALQRGEALAGQAESDVRAAELNLSYTRITASEAGQVTRKAVEPGDYVQAGQRVMALVPGQLWVTANFKETQLRHIRVGQEVRITIDAVQKRTFTGKVDSVQTGSGARFSLLPPENAVGNFVKIVQRVPVKIVFNQPLETEQTLGPGMSAVPSVHVTRYEVPEVVVMIAALVLAVAAGLTWRWAAGRGVARAAQ